MVILHFLSLSEWKIKWPQLSEILSEVFQPSHSYLTMWHYSVSSDCTDDKRRPPWGAAPRALYRQTQKRVLPTTGCGHSYFVGKDQILSSPTSMTSSEVPSGQTWCQPEEKERFISYMWSVPVPWAAEGPKLAQNHCKASKTPRGTRTSPSSGMPLC